MEETADSKGFVITSLLNEPPLGRPSDTNVGNHGLTTYGREQKELDADHEDESGHELKA